MGLYNGKTLLFMNKIHAISFLVLAALSQHCNENNPDQFTLDQQLEIKQEEVITLDLADESEYIEVQVISIMESRCPSDVTCVRYGEAKVKVSVTGLQEIATLVDLCIGECQGLQDSDTAEVTIDNKHYAVILTDVIPYPATTNQSVPKEALLRIISL